MDYGLKSDGRKHSGSGYLFSFEANKTESDQVRFFLQVNIDRVRQDRQYGENYSLPGSLAPMQLFFKVHTGYFFK